MDCRAPEQPRAQVLDLGKDQILTLLQLQAFQGRVEVGLKKMDAALVIPVGKPIAELSGSPADLFVQFTPEGFFRAFSPFQVATKKAPTTWSHNPIEIISKLQEPFLLLLHHG